MRKNRLPFLCIGIALLLLFILMSAFPSIFTSYQRKEMFEPWISPTAEHIFGTNSLGYDTFTELVYGTRETLIIGLSSSVISIIIGIVIGILSASKGFIGSFFNGLINVFTLIPKLIVLIVLSMFLGSSMINLIMLISAFSWVGLARVIRSKVMHMNEETFLQVCGSYGYSRIHTITHHVLPNLRDLVLSHFLSGITSCIMMESTLSFLGFGDVYYPTWGVMISLARSRGAISHEAYWQILAPIICIMLLSLSFYFISLFVDEKKETINDN